MNCDINEHIWGIKYNFVFIVWFQPPTQLKVLVRWSDTTKSSSERATLTTYVGNGSSSQHIIPTLRIIINIPMSKSLKIPPKFDHWVILIGRIFALDYSQLLKCIGKEEEESWIHSNSMYYHLWHSFSSNSGMLTLVSSYSLFCHWECSILAWETDAWIQILNKHF